MPENRAGTTQLQSPTTLGGKYLTFQLAGEQYGVEIIQVREIINLLRITPVPCTPEFIRGVINLRGNVIPVMDLRLKFQLPPQAETRQSCIVVVDIGTREMGLIVDSVSDVWNISAAEISETPSFGDNVNTDFILGLGKTASRVTILLDIRRILSSAEKASLPSQS